MSGCSFAVVAGYILDREHAVDDHGNRLSQVERIRDPAAQRRIKTLIESEETVTQVNFR